MNIRKYNLHFIMKNYITRILLLRILLNHENKYNTKNKFLSVEMNDTVSVHGIQ